MIDANPSASPTSSASITFALSDLQSGVTYQCSLDGAKLTTCMSPASYGPLASGSHTFEATAVAGSRTSAASGYVWTVDRTAPTTVSIVRVNPSPTNAATVAWTVTFSEAVTGVTLGAFSLDPTVAGAAKTALTGSGATYTVSADTGTGDGTLTLRLSSPAAITDAAPNGVAGTIPFVGQAYVIDKTGPLNAPTITSGPSGLVASTSAKLTFSSSESVAGYQCRLGGSGFTSCASPKSYTTLGQGSHTFQVRAVDAVGSHSPAATRTWTVDTVAPATPVLTTTPPDPSSTTTSTFDWTESSTDVASYECSTENGPFVDCGPPPITFAVSTGNGRHDFSVRAIDGAGNTSGAATYTWKVSGSSSQAYTISGTVPQPLHPGGAAQVIPISFSSPNQGNGGSGVNGTQVTNLTVSIASVAGGGPGPNPCTAADFQITQVDPLAYPFYVPYGNSALASLVNNAYLPTIRMLDRQDTVPGNGTGNQDACKNATVILAYTGTP